MRKLSKTIISLGFVLLFSVLFVGCGQTETVDGGTKVHTATITSWYGTNNEYLDTSVNINFDEIAISDIDKVTFELYQAETLLGNAVSEGENLVTLLKDCAQYWGKTAETYTEVTGDRVMSCAFKNRTEANDNGYWVRSACSATNATVPNKLIVKVLVGNIEFVTSNVSAA